MSKLRESRTFERCLNVALHGCETFDFAPADLVALRGRLRNFPEFSVHAPLPTWPDFPGRATTSFLLDPDSAKRKASLGMLHQTLQVAAEWGALYVVIHFGGLHSAGLSRERVLELADQAAAQLDLWACEWDMPLHIEYSAYNPSFATPEDHAALVSRYAHLYVCLDVGHARVGAEMLGIDEWAVVQALAPHTRSMHLWTTRDREDVGRYHHVPVHPTLTASQGWIDIPRLLDVVLTLQPDCAVVFEPDSLYNSDPVWQAEGVSWVRDLVAPYRPVGEARDASVTGVSDA